MKLYRAGYCNLRALLMYLVIYGHLIEGRLGESPALQVQYRWIYAVHMPAFAFLSGLFCNKPAGPFPSIWRRSLPPWPS